MRTGTKISPAIKNKAKDKNKTPDKAKDRNKTTNTDKCRRLNNLG